MLFLDNFSSFVNKFCADCGIDPYCRVARPIAPIPEPRGKECQYPGLAKTNSLNACGPCPSGYIYDSQDMRCESQNENPALVCYDCIWQGTGPRRFSEYLDEE